MKHKEAKPEMKKLGLSNPMTRINQVDTNPVDAIPLRSFFTQEHVTLARYLLHLHISKAKIKE